MRLRTRGLPLRLMILWVLLLAPLSAVHPAAATATTARAQSASSSTPTATPTASAGRRQSRLLNVTAGRSPTPTAATPNTPQPGAMRTPASALNGATTNAAPLAPAATGLITTVAGGGACGSSGCGDGGPAVQAQLNYFGGGAVDAAGNIFVADSFDHRVREVLASTGIITTVAGTGTSGYNGDGIAATQAQLSNPQDIALDASGNLYIADTGNQRIREVVAGTGMITTVAGTGTHGYSGDGGPAAQAALASPYGLTVDNAGDIFIDDTDNDRVREVLASTGIITTVAGTGVQAYGGDGGLATQAQLGQPRGVAVDKAGDIVIGDQDNSRIREVAASTGVITTIAGNGTNGFGGDNGPATAASINIIYGGGMALDAQGNLFFADFGNSRVREVIARTGVIITVAGTGIGGYNGDGIPATQAQLSGPANVKLDGAGNLYIVDASNNRVREVFGIAGTVPTLASGTIPWHPHQSVRFSDGLSAQVDLADGHVDVRAEDVHINGRGPDLALHHVWDSALAQSGATTLAGQGWQTDLTPSMGGVLTGTVTFTDNTSATWPFTYSTTVNGTNSYTTTPGLPWQLVTSSAGYTLTNILTDETLAFDDQGRYLSDTDSYANQNTLAYSGTVPTGETNSGGRALRLGYGSNGLLSAVQSPLWASTGGAQGQHVTYGYNGSGQLTTLTWGQGTTDALTATFGYTGALVRTLTTPVGHTWTLGYAGTGQLTSVTSPASGTVGQAGYTPAYTTHFSYSPSQTQVVQGYGSSAPLTTSYSLDNQGEPTQVTDGLNHSTSYQYDQNHDVTRVTDANNHTTSRYYQYVGPNGSTGLVTETVQPALSSYLLVGGSSDPITTRYRYDPASNDLLEVDRDIYGGITTYGYDAHHAVITTTELLDSNTSGGVGCPLVASLSPLTPQGRRQQLRSHRTLRTSLSSATCVSHTTDTWRGRVNQYDAYGERIATIDGRGVDVPNTTDTTATMATLNSTAISYTQSYSYTPQGDLAGQSTPPIVTTLNGLTQAAPATTSDSYDADGDQVAVTSANGNTTTYGYDHLGRPVQTNLPAVRLWNSSGAITPTATTRYDGEGNVVRQVDGASAVTTDSYDPLGREVAETNPVSGTSLITYSATAQVAAQDPQGNVTRSSYDPAGRLLQSTDPLSGTVQDQYDNGGNTTAITSGNAGGAVTTVETRQYDAQNHVISATVSGPGTPGQTTQTAYDADGHVAEVQQPNGDATDEFYDPVDQHVETFILPAGSNSSSADAQTVYDHAGNAIESIDFDNRLEQTQYDGANRVVQSTDTYTYTPALTTSVSYDPDGTNVSRTVQSVGPTGQVQTATSTEAVNADDWPITTTDILTSGQQLATAYGYDGAGQQRTQTILNGVTPITTTLNAEGLVTASSESLGGATYSSTFAYNANDLPLTTTLPGGVQETAQYDKASRLTHVGATGPTHQIANPLSSSYDYGYNAVGWTTGVTATINTVNRGKPVAQTLTHDALGRLTSVQSGSSTQSFGYDSNGNLLTAASSGVTTTYGYNNSLTPNEVLTLATSGQPTTYYGYDTTGDTTSITNTGTISTGLSYDSQARLVGVTLQDGTQATLAYNSAGQRSRYVVSKPGQPTLTQTFTYRGDELGQAVVVTGTTTYTDTYLYTQDGAPLELLRQQNGTTSRYWYVLDGRGNVVALTDSTGNVVNRYAYDVWGALTSVSESVPQRLRYAGYWYDQELGWYWVSVRMYDPSLKRWLQPDPSEAEGVHTYVYVGDDPIDATDPQGLGGLCNVPLLGGVSCALGALAHGAWNFVAGDDLATLRDAHAHGVTKFLAIVDLSSNALTLVPVVGEGVLAAKLALKAAVKVGAKVAAREIGYEEARQLALRLARRGLKKAAEACALCFSAGTLVATTYGLRAIERLHAGDTVLAENPATGKVEAEPVQALIKDPVSPLLAVDLSDGSAITVTADHPFWVDRGNLLASPGWLPAGQLRRGDHLRTASGVDVVVTGLRYNVGHAAVYTLTVARDHTFFVGTARVLVHNANCVRDLLMPSGAAIGRAGSSEAIREVSGGLSAAQDLFAKLTQGGIDVTPSGYPGKLAELPGGGRVGLRFASKSGPPTIDVNIPGIPIKKIKFL